MPWYAVPHLLPVRWLVIDMETGNAEAEAVEENIAGWRAPSNWKPETVERKREEARQKVKERAALLDASPILCIALRTERLGLILNGMDNHEYTIEGWHSIACGEEEEMLLTLRCWLDEITDEGTKLVGHNIRRFDLPKLRNAYIRKRMRLPMILVPRMGEERPTEVVDTMSLFRSFSMEHNDDAFTALDTVADSLGIPRPKQIISGEQVPALYEDGEIEVILTYVAIDAATTMRAYQLMTSTAADLL